MSVSILDVALGITLGAWFTGHFEPGLLVGSLLVVCVVIETVGAVFRARS
jgi:hypothetical protein